MPIKGIQQQKLDERKHAFFREAQGLCASKAFSHLNFATSLDAFSVVAEAYFYLSEGYKPERIPLKSKTRLAKVAAMTSLAIGYVKPIRAPSDCDTVNDEEYLYVNGVLAMRLACGLVRFRFDKRPFDDRRRSYRMVQGIEFPSLEPLIREANSNKGQIQTEFTPKLSEDELCTIDSHVETFEIYCYLGEHDQSFR